MSSRDCTQIYLVPLSKGSASTRTASTHAQAGILALGSTYSLPLPAIRCRITDVKAPCHRSNDLAVHPLGWLLLSGFRPPLSQWVLAVFVPDHSGGTAPDSHGIPYQAYAHLSVSYQITQLFSSRTRHCQIISTIISTGVSPGTQKRNRQKHEGQPSSVILGICP